MTTWPPRIDYRLAQLEDIVGGERLEGALLVAIEAAKAAITVNDLAKLTGPRTINLNDPETENLVADAIRRLAPEGEYVPLSVRYPWRFGPFADLTTPESNLVDVLVEALRGSASAHEAGRIPHLAGPLLALAEALEHGALVPGPPPGPCPSFSSEVIEIGEVGFRYPCELRATHAGMHEATPYAARHPVGKMRWSDPVDVEATS